jgi:hypothetical protein
MVHFKAHKDKPIATSAHQENSPTTPLKTEQRAPIAPVDGNNRPMVTACVKNAFPVVNKQLLVPRHATIVHLVNTKIKKESPSAKNVQMVRTVLQFTAHNSQTRV